MVLLGLFGVAVIVAGVAAYKTLSFVSSVSTASLGDNVRSVVSSVSLQPTPTPVPAVPQRVNVLLLGFGGAGHEGADLTDSILVLSLDPKTGKAAMISIPRDTWVRIPTDGARGGFWKLNTAYALGLDDQGFPNKQPQFKGKQGGGNLAAYVVGSMLGMKIDYWLAVDFRAFKSVVDALGGVDVNVQTAFTDYYYPRNDNPAIDPGWMTVHFNAGLQHMNGERALEFARSRHSLEDGSDFARSRRQQLLLLAIKNKALTPEGLTKVFGLMDALSGDFTTNLTIGQARALTDRAKGLDQSSIDRISIDDTNYLVDGFTADGQSVLIPADKSWAQIRGAVASIFLDPAIKAEGARIQLVNATGDPTLAATAAAALDQIGLAVLPGQGVSAAVPHTEIHDFSQGRGSLTASYLASLFNAQVTTEAAVPDSSVDVKIVLGQDYAAAASSIVDDYDPEVHIGAPPPPTPEPKLTPTVKAGTPGPATTAAAQASSRTSARPSAPSSPRALATVTTSGARPTAPAPTAAH